MLLGTLVHTVIQLPLDRAEILRKHVGAVALPYGGGVLGVARESNPVAGANHAVAP
jgi:hypothetical protein